MAFLKDAALNISHFIGHVAVSHCMVHTVHGVNTECPRCDRVYPIFWYVHVIISGYQ